MKTKLETRHHRNTRFLTTTILTLAVPALVIGAAFTDLDVGMVNNSATFQSAAIGTNNTATQLSTSIGSSNYAAYRSTSTGGSNIAHDLSFASGHSNSVYNLSAAIGYWNDVNTVSGQHPRHSVAIGLSNYIVGNSSLAAGSSNIIEADNAMTFGRGLVSTAVDATVVGTYNTDKTGLRFAIGNGTGPAAATRANALEVYANGDIIMTKPQGDISMGEFTAGQ
jgi:hypothetical protein